MSKTQTIPKTNLGPLYAALLALAWAVLHFYGLFIHTLSSPLWQTIAIIATLCWLYTGLFIVAHDTMHGSFAKSEKINAVVGTVILFIYAGFNWRQMRAAHHAHHKSPGTPDDPDFNAANPHVFWPWYMKFFVTYFSWKQVIILFAFTVFYVLLGTPYQNTIVMWALPAILSSVQLFYFGTYRTHKHGAAFPDHHNARTNDFPRWLSLLTCFHFGYHHEHHLFPQDPWWRLPKRKFAP